MFFGVHMNIAKLQPNLFLFNSFILDNHVSLTVLCLVLPSIIEIIWNGLLGGVKGTERTSGLIWYFWGAPHYLRCLNGFGVHMNIATVKFVHEIWDDGLSKDYEVQCLL